MAVNGSLYTWGANNVGQVSDETTDNRSYPIFHVKCIWNILDRLPISWKRCTNSI